MPPVGRQSMKPVPNSSRQSIGGPSPGMHAHDSMQAMMSRGDRGDIKYNQQQQHHDGYRQSDMEGKPMMNQMYKMEEGRSPVTVGNQGQSGPGPGPNKGLSQGSGPGSGPGPGPGPGTPLSPPRGRMSQDAMHNQMWQQRMGSQQQQQQQGKNGPMGHNIPQQGGGRSMHMSMSQGQGQGPGSQIQGPGQGGPGPGQGPGPGPGPGQPGQGGHPQPHPSGQGRWFCGWRGCSGLEIVVD
ncbi:hypothetical protein SARC_10873 [Sphaeroforma arctica JP610]|uniref:Uncharacterized protein n=1 Tax=Sphaeroforma arctica JP610 TaxID=667725 RepID=A0A0L0FIN0_9EUKA|nr:hypothetical protein SARC_10873 [Sphaeroforma arctica JP610]KNC76632.1 hypothetical protein SARC_10873 [Sphaeroforma arctica JP610]|eukprot:XP_014150534.1 hypothetical protein SARC_10873 [Sphaeroforma arctica JP610]